MLSTRQYTFKYRRQSLRYATLLQSFIYVDLHTSQSFLTKCSKQIMTLVCNVQWLGLRSDQIQAHQDYIYMAASQLTLNDRQVIDRLKANIRARPWQQSDQYQKQMQSMVDMGKYELQCLYAHPLGISYFAHTFVKTAILHHDYI